MDKDLGFVLFGLVAIGLAIFWTMSTAFSPTAGIATQRYETRIELCNEWELTEKQKETCIHRAVEERVRESLKPIN